MIARRTGLALAIAALGIGPITAQQPRSPDPAAAPTPRMADGHPDLNGWWGGNFVFGGFGKQIGEMTDAQGNVNFPLPARSQGSALGAASGQVAVNFERDAGVGQRADPNKPIYKAEYWEKVQFLDTNGNAEDPNFACAPAGVPRMGFPNKIVATASEVVFLYETENTFRWIPIDKPHHPDRDATYKGDSVARWDGDTLVVDTTNFNENTWLDWPGYFHSDQLQVVERLTRRGNVVLYEVTIEDRGVLQRPWVMNPRRIPLNLDPKAAFWEDPPCDDKDLEHIVTKERG